MKTKIWEKLDPLVAAGNIREAISILKETLVKCEDTLEACFLARDLAELYKNLKDITKAIHFGFLAGEGFVREGEIYHAMSLSIWLKEIATGKEKSEQLKNLISETFSVLRPKKKEQDSNFPIPTPFQEFTASVSLENESEGEVPRNQLESSSSSNQFALFSSLRSVETAHLIDVVKTKKLSGSEILYEEGKASAQMFILVSGSLLLLSKSGVRKILKPGDFVGDVSCLAGVQRGSTVRAQEETELLEFSGKNISESFKKFKNLQEKIWKFFEKRLFLNIALRSELFKNLTSEELVVCFDHSLSVSPPPTRVLMHEARPVDRLSFIVQGECERTDRFGKSMTLGVGRFFGEIDFLKNQTSSFKVTAKNEVYVLEWHRETFDKLCFLFPRLNENIELLSLKPGNYPIVETTVID
ncbi:MAG: crp [Bacteriovoracaceae bacterium]|nr:crp [Bacteriovoracaceae bacterium]